MKKFASILIALAILASLSIPPSPKPRQARHRMHHLPPEHGHDVLANRAADAEVTLLLDTTARICTVNRPPPPTSRKFLRVTCQLLVGESDAW
jgi:hypothetical protein